MSKLSGDHVKVLVDGYDVTGDSNRISISENSNLINVTGFGDQVRKFIPGQRTMAVQHAGFMNSSDVGSHPALQGVDVDGLFSIYVGENAEPKLGDPVFSMLTRQGRYSASPQVNQMIPFRAVFANRGDNGGWGVALANPRRVSSSSAGSAVDNGASTDGGGLACLHVLEAADSNVYTFRIEGSANGRFVGEEITLATFTLGGGAVGSQQIKIGGAIPRYARWVAKATGSGEVRIAISLIRTHELTASPQGLLTDFQFASVSLGDRLLLPDQMVEGSRWLNMTKADGTNVDFPVQEMVWEAVDSTETNHRPLFDGHDAYNWIELSTLLPSSSFYVYLPGDQRIFEFSIASSEFLGFSHIGFDTTSRPASVVEDSQIRVLVADNGQKDLIKNWIEAGYRPEAIPPPDELSPPQVTAGDGLVDVTILPHPPSDEPITTYEIDVRAVNSQIAEVHVINLNTLTYPVRELTNGEAYEIKVAAVNRGGRGPWSPTVEATPRSS